MIHRTVLLALGLAVSAPLHAQTHRDIIDAIKLPRAADEAREEGVPEKDVRTAIEGAFKKGVPASETKEVMNQSTRAVRENGPIDNFGAFVQSQLDRGLRGRELAAAIHAEHARRGIGKGKKLKRSKGWKGANPGEVERARTEAERGRGQADEWVNEKAKGKAKAKVKDPGEGGDREQEREKKVKEKQSKVKKKGRGRQGGRSANADTESSAGVVR
jgi:hypothetical protein